MKLYEVQLLILITEHHDDIVAWTNKIQVLTSLLVKQMKVLKKCVSIVDT